MVSLKDLMKKFETSLKVAKKKKSTELVVLTTKRNHYIDDLKPNGYGAEDLKPEYKDFYKKLLCEYDVFTRPVNVSNQEISWVVNVK